MNKQTKKEIRRLAVKVLMVVFALGLAFWGYAFVYRGKTEPPAKYLVTNQDAAVYSLRGQIQMLSQQEELNKFAFDGKRKGVRNLYHSGAEIYQNVSECTRYEAGSMYIHDPAGPCGNG